LTIRAVHCSDPKEGRETEEFLRDAYRSTITSAGALSCADTIGLDLSALCYKLTFVWA
jgi:hypothetical protein